MCMQSYHVQIIIYRIEMNNNRVKDFNNDGAMKAWLVKKKEIWSEMHKEKKEKERREKEEKELKIRESQAAWEKWKERKETLRKQQMVGIYRYIYMYYLYILCIYGRQRGCPSSHGIFSL